MLQEWDDKARPTLLYLVAAVLEIGQHCVPRPVKIGPIILNCDASGVCGDSAQWYVYPISNPLSLSERV
jgi:hypothetical protein